jgi:hypothetical protein
MIYFILSGNGRFVKIGHCTGDPKARLSQLQTGNPEKLTLVSVKDGGRGEEGVWHSRFEHLRVRGEWFEWTEDLRYAAGPLFKDEATQRELRCQYARALVAGRRGDANRAYARLLGGPSWSTARRQAQIAKNAQEKVGE